MKNREVRRSEEAIRPLPLDGEKWAKIARDLGLSPRHKEVIELILQGKRDKAIAAELGLAVPTVRTYLGRLFERLEVTDRVDLILKIFAASHDRASGATRHRR